MLINTPQLGIYEDPDGAPDASTSGHEDLHQEVQRLTQQLAEMTELHAASEMRLQQLAEQLTAAQQLEATQKEEIEALKQQQERPSVPGQEQVRWWHPLHWRCFLLVILAAVCIKRCCFLVI